MGIYDREYVRVGPHSPSGLGNLRGWSFNTWLIAINILVFVADALLSASGVNFHVDMGTRFYKDVTAEQEKNALVTPLLMPPQILGDAVLPGARGLAIINNLGDSLTETQLADGEFVAIGSTPAVVIDGKPYPVIGARRFAVEPPIRALFHFSAGKLFWPHLEFWRLLGFQFLHGSPMHLLFNMMGLFFFGGLVEGYLGAKRYAAFYLVCGVFGAVAYMLLNAIGQLLPNVPGLLFNDIYTPLIGASAGVFGVLLAAAFIAPTAQILLFFVIPMKLRTAVYLFIGFALYILLTGGRNAGGQAAHIGGAAAGFYFIRHTHLLRDFFEVLGPRKSKAPRTKRLSTPRGGPNDAEIDAILSKVATGGLHSLTESERRTLRRATEARRR